MRLEITDSCCATARRLIGEGLDPGEVLEFCRGDTVCLRGKAGDFAKLTVREDERIGPVFVRYEPMTPEAKARLGNRVRRQERLNRPPLGVGTPSPARASLSAAVGGVSAGPIGLPGLAVLPEAPIGLTGPAG